VVEVRETQELNKLVLDKIQRLDGVKETNTRIAFD
jgi:DNA-binding Lrp family transcriptional regulator